MSLGEIVVLLIVGIVVIGPKNLPSMMRTAGQWVTKLRRMSTDLRSQSGIDDLIRHEGLEKEIAELRSLARMNVVDTLIKPAFGAVPVASVGARDYAPYNSGSGVAPALEKALEFHPYAPLREREYPLAGCDAYGALADDAPSYTAHDPEIVATEAPNAIAMDADGHMVDADGHAIDADGHVIDADGHTISALGQVGQVSQVIDAEGHVLHAPPAPPASPAANVAAAEEAAPAEIAASSATATSVTVALPASAQESAPS